MRVFTLDCRIGAVGVAAVDNPAGWDRTAVAVGVDRSGPAARCHTAAGGAAGHMQAGRSLVAGDIGLGYTGQVGLGRSLAEGGSLPGRSSLDSGYRKDQT